MPTLKGHCHELHMLEFVCSHAHAIMDSRMSHVYSQLMNSMSNIVLRI